MIVEPPTALYISGETGRVVLDDRVVLREAADVRAGRPVLARLQLPVELVARVVGAVEPVALLEADDAEAGLGEAHRDDAARRAGTDDQDVCRFGAPSVGRTARRSTRLAREQADLPEDAGEVGSLRVRDRQQRAADMGGLEHARGSAGIP